MKEGMKEKRSKKKNINRRDDKMLIDNENDDIKADTDIHSISEQVSYPMEQEYSITNCLDLNLLNPNNISLIGRKGHLNFYSKQTVLAGTYYFEVNVTSMDYYFTEYIYNRRIDEFTKKYYEPIMQNMKSYMPNIRIGFINASGDKDIPIGAEEKSYGYRASDGVIINDGMYKEGNETFNQGDCLGALIHLKPPKPSFLKGTDSEESEKNNECFIKFFKNGIEQSNGFIGIYEGNYYAAITLYNFSQAVLNFGPKFRYMNLEENKNVKSFYDVCV